MRQLDHGDYVLATCRARPTYQGRPLRECALQLQGRTFRFGYGWTMDDDDPYPGEMAMIPRDPEYPDDAPHWLASGDLVEVVEP